MRAVISTLDLQIPHLDSGDENLGNNGPSC